MSLCTRSVGVHQKQPDARAHPENLAQLDVETAHRLQVADVRQGAGTHRIETDVPREPQCGLAGCLNVARGEDRELLATQPVSCCSAKAVLNAFTTRARAAFF